jgi:hypothetical protein
VQVPFFVDLSDARRGTPDIHPPHPSQALVLQLLPRGKRYLTPFSQPAGPLEVHGRPGGELPNGEEVVRAATWQVRRNAGRSVSLPKKKSEISCLSRFPPRTAFVMLLKENGT